jgi:gas vesicle protein
MKYKKLLSDSASHLTDNASKLTDSVRNGSDSSNAIVALLTGLAVGAVLGVLFAPSSGEETRSLIADKATGLGEDLKDRYQTVKDKVAAGADDLIDLKDRAVDNVKSKASGLTQEFKDFKQNATGGSAVPTEVKNAADDANDAIQNA